MTQFMIRASHAVIHLLPNIIIILYIYFLNMENMKIKEKHVHFDKDLNDRKSQR